jgi:hypothetical protein
MDINYAEFYSNCIPSDLLAQVGFTFVSTRGGFTRMKFPSDPKSASVVVNEITGAVIDHRSNPICPNGASSGSVSQVLQQHGGLSKHEAFKLIKGDSSDDITIRRKEIQAQAKKQKTSWLTMQYVDKLAQNLHLALPYLKQRHISEQYARITKLGYKPNHRYRAEGTLKDGTVIAPIACNRHTIPIFRTRPEEKVLMMSLRRDEQDADQRLERVDRGLIQKIEAEGADVKDMMFGPKYISFVTSRFIFQGWLLRRKEGTQIVSPHYKSVLIAESQYDAINLYEIGRLPAVATKGHPFLHQALENADMVYVILDNDKQSIDPATGETYYPGERIAQHTVTQTGRKLGHNIAYLRPYEGFKDVGEMVQKGVFHDWMTDNSLLTSQINPLF